MNHIKRYKILSRLHDYNLNTNNYNTELVYHSKFELLIAVLLSAQARDAQVNKATKILFKIANTPQAILVLGINKIKNYIKCIGLFNCKAKNIVETCRLIIKKHNGTIPNNRIDLEKLPGVGRKTANIILNIAFGFSTIAVDTHVFRVCNRSKFATGKNVYAVEQKLMSVVPKEFRKDCHKWFVRHGRYTCFSKNPRCHSCIIQDLCEFKKK